MIKPSSVLTYIILIPILFLLTSCASYDFNGAWFTPTGDLYTFTDGKIYCENNYVTLENGEKLSGTYYQESSDQIKVYIPNLVENNDDFVTLYVLHNNDCDTLSYDSMGKNIVFYSNLITVKRLIATREAAAQKAQAKKEEEQIAAEKAHQEKISSSPLVSYDDIKAGKHNNQMVAIEAIVSSFQYDKNKDKYVFDLWYWSEHDSKYIRDEKCTIYSFGRSEDDIEALQSVDDGDTIKIVLTIPSEHSFILTSEFIRFDLVKKGDLSEYNITNIPTTNTTIKDTYVSKGSISDIAVHFETDVIDGDRLHLIVFTKNNSEETFDGNVYVTFYSSDGKEKLGSDTIYVEKLLPGRESWANVTVKAYTAMPKMTVDFSEVSFTPIQQTTAEIDEDATSKTKNSYRLGFEGVSWYNDIIDIIVYSDGTCTVVLTDNPKEQGQFYASVIWGCGNNYGVKQVQAIDAAGKILSVFKK